MNGDSFVLCTHVNPVFRQLIVVNWAQKFVSSFLAFAFAASVRPTESVKLKDKSFLSSEKKKKKESAKSKNGAQFIFDFR